MSEEGSGDIGMVGMDETVSTKIQPGYQIIFPQDGTMRPPQPHHQPGGRERTLLQDLQ